MIVVDIALLVLAVVTVVAVVTAVSANRARARELAASTRPDRDLARAARLLDRILQVDAVMPSLPGDLANEARDFVNAFYENRQGKELGR